MLQRKKQSDGNLSVTIPCDSETAHILKLLAIKSEYKEILHNNWLKALNSHFDNINEFELITFLKEFPALDNEIQKLMKNKRIAESCHTEIEKQIKHVSELLELLKDINLKITCNVAKLEAMDAKELNRLVTCSQRMTTELVLLDVAVIRSDQLFARLGDQALLALAKRHCNDRLLINKITEILFAQNCESQLRNISSLHAILTIENHDKFEEFELPSYDIRIKSLYIVKLLQDFITRRSADPRECKSSLLWITIGPSKNTELAAASAFIEMLNKGVAVEDWRKLNTEYKKALLQKNGELNDILNVFNSLCKSEIFSSNEYDSYDYRSNGLH